MRPHSLFYVEALVLICLSVVSLLILGIMYVLKFRGMPRDGHVYGSSGNVFQGPTEWADINEAADPPRMSGYGEKEQ